MLNSIRDRFTHLMQMRATRLYGSRVGWRIAPRYAEYHKYCRAKFGDALPDLGPLRSSLDEFKVNGIASFWTPENEKIANTVSANLKAREASGEVIWGETGPSGNKNYLGNLYLDCPELEQLFRGSVGDFLTSYYGTYFKIFYASMLKSRRIEGDKSGSQLWHSDSGPGSCVIIAYYLHDVDADSGVLHALPWKQSIEIYRHEQRAIANMAKERGIVLRSASRDTRRQLLTTYYQRAIDKDFRGFVRAPMGKAGLVVPFLNNTLHFGGFPSPGRERVAILVHCYPSDHPTNFTRYRRDGLAKIAPYPLDPSEPF